MKFLLVTVLVALLCGVITYVNADALQVLPEEAADIEEQRGNEDDFSQDDVGKLQDESPEKDDVIDEYDNPNEDETNLARSVEKFHDDIKSDEDVKRSPGWGRRRRRRRRRRRIRRIFRIRIRLPKVINVAKKILKKLCQLKYDDSRLGKAIKWVCGIYQTYAGKRSLDDPNSPGKLLLEFEEDVKEEHLALLTK